MVIDVKKLYEDIDKYMGSEVRLQGWIRNHRKQKEFGFIDFNDGTFFKGVQVVYDESVDGFGGLEKLIAKGQAIDEQITSVF